MTESSDISDRTHELKFNKFRKRRSLSDLFKWFMFPFLFFNAAFVLAFYFDDIAVMGVWYLRAYFYLFFIAQIWLLSQFFLYISMKPPEPDHGTRFRDPFPDNALTVMVSCFNEPPEIIEKTIRETRLVFSGRIMLLDDSTEGRKGNNDIAQRYGADHMVRSDRRGYKAGAINDALSYVNTPYVALLDSDAVPKREFFDIGLSYSRAYDIVQFPQYYANREMNSVTRGAYAQQIPFMYRIMPLRSSRNSAFMLGSNLIFKREVVLDLGGFDETSVTEDLATSIKFHKKGYRSIYISKNTVDNLAPESLRAYFVQQKRWAEGNIHVFRSFMTDPGRTFSIHRYADYFVGSSWYLYGLVFPFLASSVFFFSIFHISFVFTTDSVYYTLYMPLILLTFLIYFITLKQTGHGLKDMYYNMSFNSICFPIFASGVLKGMLGRKFVFTRTPKSNMAKAGRLGHIVPHLILCSLLTVSVVVSLFNVVKGIQTIPFLTNAGWGIYYIVLLLPIFRDPY